MPAVWRPLDLLMLVFRGHHRPASQTARRWSDAFQRDPELRADLVRLGRVLDVRPTRFEDGQEMADPIDPLRLAFEDGQRDLALKLLALGSVSSHDLYQMMERNDVP